MTRITRQLIATVGLSLLLATAGCTLVRLAYDNGDRLLMSRLDKFINFNDEQRERVAGALDERLAQHRREELPRLGRLLEMAAAAVARGYGEAEVDAVAAELESIVRQLVQRSLPVLTLALSDLAETQVTFLEEQLGDALEDYRKTWGVHEPPADRLRNRALRAVELVEGWTGELREPQVEIVKAVRNAMPDSAGTWANYRAERQAQLVTMLRARRPPAEVERYLGAWLLELADASPELGQMRTGINAGIRRLLLDLEPTLDAKQRERVAERLLGYADDAKTLASQAPSNQ